MLRINNNYWVIRKKFIRMASYFIPCASDPDFILILLFIFVVKNNNNYNYNI